MRLLEIPVCSSFASHLATWRAKLWSWIFSKRGITSENENLLELGATLPEHA